MDRTREFVSFIRGEKLFFIDIDENISFFRYERLLSVLPMERQLKIRRYHFDIDRKLSLFSELFVRFLACSILNVENSYIKFGKNEYGKPFLMGSTGFNYNISHTRNAIVVGVSQEPIGVDVEKIRGFERGIADRFFCEDELHYIIANKSDASRRFYEIWTKKEAYIKWIGKGLSIPLNSFDVLELQNISLFCTLQINGYCVSICSKCEFRKDDYIRLDEQILYELLMGFFDF